MFVDPLCGSHLSESTARSVSPVRGGCMAQALYRKINIFSYIRKNINFPKHLCVHLCVLLLGGRERRKDVRRKEVRQGGREGVDSEIAMIGGLARCLGQTKFPFKFSIQSKVCKSKLNTFYSFNFSWRLTMCPPKRTHVVRRIFCWRA